MTEVVHAPATTDQLIEWLLQPEMTIGTNLRKEIAERLERLESQKPVFYDIGALKPPHPVRYMT